MRLSTRLSTASSLLRTILTGSLAVVLLSLAGCASQRDADLGATFDPLAPFPATAVWAWDDAQNKLPDDGRLDRQSVDRNIKSAVAAEFAAKGYSETSESLVHYMLSYELGILTWMSHTDARSYGTLSVLMTEAGSGRKVWLGFVRMQIDRSLTPAQRSERLRENLAEMLGNFPPSQP
jgi:hypothetical protein